MRGFHDRTRSWPPQTLRHDKTILSHQGTRQWRRPINNKPTPITEPRCVIKATSESRARENNSERGPVVFLECPITREAEQKSQTSGKFHPHKADRRLKRYCGGGRGFRAGEHSAIGGPRGGGRVSSCIGTLDVQMMALEVARMEMPEGERMTA